MRQQHRPDANLCHLQWGMHAGRSWELVEGLDQGQTQTDCPADGDMAVWSHPVDVHYTCRGLLGWPKLHFQIWSQDVHGRNELRELLMVKPVICTATASAAVACNNNGVLPALQKRLHASCDQQ